MSLSTFSLDLSTGKNERHLQLCTPTMAMSIFSFLHLLTFGKTRNPGDNLETPLSPTHHPHPAPVRFSQLRSSNYPLSRITAAAPRPSLPTHLSAGRNRSVRFGSQSPALFESLGAFLLQVRKLLGGPGGQTRSLRPALPTLLASPLQPLSGAKIRASAPAPAIFSLSYLRPNVTPQMGVASQFRYLPCDPHTARPMCHYPFIYM